MAKITINGDSVVITSAAKLTDIALAEKHRPDALVVKGGEDGKTELFRVATGKNAAVDKYGIIFAAETRGEEKLATMTLILDKKLANIEDVYEAIEDKFGSAIAYLNEVEQRLPCVLEEIEISRNAFRSCVTVIQ